MQKRSSKKKKPHDPNALAFQIVQEATGVPHPQPPHVQGEADPITEARSAAAAMLGRLGGLKGGAARAKALSKKQRQEIARKAARARWKRRKT
jgi:hypothetical protein